jgi:hypothetical protein
MALQTIFGGESPTGPTRASIHAFRKKAHELYSAIGRKKNAIEQLRIDAADPYAGLHPVRPDPTLPQAQLQPGTKPAVRPTRQDVAKAEREFEDMEREYATLNVIIKEYDTEHPQPTPQEQQRSLLIAREEQQKRYFVDAQLDVAAGNASAEQLEPIRDELARCAQAVIDHDDTVRREAEHAALVAKAVPEKRTRLLDQLARFNRVTTEQQQIADELRVSFREIDSLKDAHGRVTGIRGEVLALALPFEQILRWNFDAGRPIRLFERWQRAFSEQVTK